MATTRLDGGAGSEQRRRGLKRRKFEDGGIEEVIGGEGGGGEADTARPTRQGQWMRLSVSVRVHIIDRGGLHRSLFAFLRYRDPPAHIFHFRPHEIQKM